VRAVFTLITFIFIVCVALTVTSFREIPLRLLEGQAQVGNGLGQCHRLTRYTSTARLVTDGLAARRMPSSGMLRRVAVVRTGVSEELSASMIRLTRSGELGTTLAVTSNRRTLERFVFLRSVRRFLVRLTLFLVHLFLSP
jgi:hypothetical protein